MEQDKTTSNSGETDVSNQNAADQTVRFLLYDPFEFHVERLRSSEDFKRNEMLFAVVLAVIAALLLYRVGEAAHGIDHSVYGMALFGKIYTRLKDNIGAILPPLAALFYVWHMWIHYSQILFYAEDTITAQKYTTITASVVIITSAFVLPFTRLWLLAFAISTFAVFVKSIQVRLQAEQTPGHPFTKRSKSWLWSAGLGTASLFILACNVLFAVDFIYSSLVAVGIMSLFTVKYVWFYSEYKAELADAMREYWGYGEPGKLQLRIEMVES